jgi:GntP family gluconate:H+ symporter
MAGVGVLIALGAMFGKILADSGGADQIVDTIIGRSSRRMLPWAMALVGALIGLPMFFEIGLVLLMPVILLVARRSELPLYKIALPALAGLSAMHGLVPPHPGPLTAIAALNANLGLTLVLGILVAVPTVIVAGPLLSTYVARWVDVPVPPLFASAEEKEVVGVGGRSGGSTGVPTDLPEEPKRPSFRVTLFTVLLPVALMMIKAVADIVAEDSTSPVKQALDFIGAPLMALLLAVLVGMLLLGRGAGSSLGDLNTMIEKSLPPIAGIVFIVGAGGGFKQVLIDSGIGDVIAGWVSDSSISPLLLAWCVAALIRVATGSATVATVAAAGILQPVTEGLTTSHTSLLVLAIGAGSLFLSHLNDAGFWLTKEFMGVTVSQNLKSWTVMECVISVFGLAAVLTLGAII